LGFLGPNPFGTKYDRLGPGRPDTAQFPALGATTALGRKQDMQESVDSATATGGDVTATPPALAAVDFDVDRQPGCFCTAHNANAGAAAYGEKKKNVESKQVSPTT
jgi:hypothetical protein